MKIRSQLVFASFGLTASVLFAVPAANAEVPGLRGVQHIGVTVPDLQKAIDFFVDVIGCQSFFSNSIGPFKNDWMRENLDVNPEATLTNHRIRCGNGTNFELFEYTSPDQRTEMPKNSDYGGTHIAFYVDNIEATVEYLRSHNVKLLGNIKANTTEGHPTKGMSWIYAQAPWGAYLEFLTYPESLGYEGTTDQRLWSPRD